MKNISEKTCDEATNLFINFIGERQEKRVYFITVIY